MNLEFQSAAKPTMNGLHGINAKTETPSANQSRGHERKAQFKDLLDQSKQADYQLEKVQENRRESKAIAESNRRDDDQQSSKDIDVKPADEQVEEPVMEKLKHGENQEETDLSTLDTAQLMVIQSFQGGIESGRTQLNLNLGHEENKMPTDLNESGQTISLTKLDDQLPSIPFSEMVPRLDETVQEEVPVLQQEIGRLENQAVESTEGLLKNSGAELATTEAPSDVMDFSKQLVNRSGIEDEPEVQMLEGISPKQGNQAAEVKPEKFVMAFSGEDLEDKVGLTIEVDEKDELVFAKKTDVEQTAPIEVQTNGLRQIENQNPEEKGVQELNVTGINTGKAPEVQADTKVEIAQQVEQKILQNFVPNKPMVLQMTLSPDNLGDIDIKLSYDQGKLIIDITAISQETQNLLGKQINLLVRGLALQNVQVETVHLNTPVEQSSDSQDAAFMMNSGSDPNENQNQTLLREQFIKNNRGLNRVLTISEEDESVVIPQNLQNYTNHKVNYLI